MKKIVFGITSLSIGGAERVLVDLANELSKANEYSITIFTIYGKGELEEQVSSKVTIKNIYKESYNKLKNIFIPFFILIGKNKIYKKYIKNKYDIEIAFLEGAITRIFSSGKEKQKKIAWIHNDISQVFGAGIKAKLKRKIDENLYNKFSKLIFVSKSNLQIFKRTYPDNKVEKQVIYNYIDSKRVLKKAAEQMEIKFDKAQINLVIVARLVLQKALDRLIKVHSRLIKEGLTHYIYIIGEGPEKERLQELIIKNNCEKTVKLLGKKENPYPYIKKANYLCLLSQFEGYGMVLEEAKILDKYILITNTAAKEAVENYEKSEIFENSEEGIYIGLKQRLGTCYNCLNIQEIAEQKYNNSNIIENVRELLK